MKICIDGLIREMTSEEIAIRQAEKEAEDVNYWKTISYDKAVNAEIRKKYTESQEFAILRQKEEKPEEYKAYYDYCEECKQKCRNIFDFTLL